MTESIVVRNVEKQFTLQYHRTVKQMAVAAVKGHKLRDTFKALDDVSFTVEQGESIGLMGLNGSGKSTLLKLINGVMRPDGGQILTRGRIAGLIATGAGFHSQLSGRDNLYLNAAILGMSEAETKRKFDSDRRVRRHRQVPRFPGRPLLVGNGCSPRIRHRRPRRLRHLPRR